MTTLGIQDDETQNKTQHYVFDTIMPEQQQKDTGQTKQNTQEIQKSKMSNRDPQPKYVVKPGAREG